jgi:enoyl-CoA hydratase/carnithine racemase
MTTADAQRRARWAARAVLLALWCSLLVAAVGAGLWAREVGVGLVVGGLGSAALLLWVVDVPDRPKGER